MSNTDLNALKDLINEAVNAGADILIRSSDPWERVTYEELKIQLLSELHTKLEEIIKPV